MGRYAYLDTHDTKDLELALSGIFAQAVCKAVGDERGRDSVVTLTKLDIYNTMWRMVRILEERVDQLNFQEIQAKEVGYRKLSILMEWYCDAKDEDSLSFA